MTYSEAVNFPAVYAKTVEAQDRDKHFSFFTDGFTYKYRAGNKIDTVNYAQMVNVCFDTWGKTLSYSYKIKKTNLKEMDRDRAQLEVDVIETYKLQDKNAYEYTNERTSIYKLVKTSQAIKIESIEDTKFVRKANEKEDLN